MYCRYNKTLNALYTRYYHLGKTPSGTMATYTIESVQTGQYVNTTGYEQAGEPVNTAPYPTVCDCLNPPLAQSVDLHPSPSLLVILLTSLAKHARAWKA